jgi:hypothetical protein
MSLKAGEAAGIGSRGTADQILDSIVRYAQRTLRQSASTYLTNHWDRRLGELNAARQRSVGDRVWVSKANAMGAVRGVRHTERGLQYYVEWGVDQGVGSYEDDWNREMVSFKRADRIVGAWIYL